MWVRFNPKAEEELLNESKYIENAETLQKILSNEENKNKKVYLEIGMGKGDFISQLSSEDKDNIYIVTAATQCEFKFYEYNPYAYSYEEHQEDSWYWEENAGDSGCCT